ncbi:MAG: SPOR domain-containing protein [Pseudomonadota bacterium]|nr:SPOR domain-containing protein [Pseudomonadota bacterium]
MLTRPETADPAVEELKRRARRRLVGAIVLALAAAVLLPLLLESDPKPLGDDVSIQIPPIDSGKFITPLSPAKGTEGKVVADRSAPPLPSASPQPPRVGASSDATGDAKPSGADAAAKAAEPAQRAPSDIAPSPAPKATSMIASTPDAQKPAAEGPKGASADPRPAEAAGTGFVVQLAAFADAKAAASLASKLKSAGFPAYVETSKTAQGTMRRVRVGPYAARDAADAQLVKLGAAGYQGVVTTK